MKTTLLLSLALAGFAPAAMADGVTFSPETMQGLSISPDGFYVGGSTRISEPAIWTLGVPYIAYESGELGGINAMANNGTGCGSTDSNLPFTYSATVAEADAFQILDVPDNEEGTAWAISADGTIAVGCTWDTDTYRKIPCYWTGTERHLLEFPAEDIPFDTNGASAKGISNDGSIIYGNIDDWMADQIVLWLRNEVTGEYEFLPLYEGLVDKTGEMPTGEYPYYQLSGCAISGNGEWLALDAMPWDSFDTFPARMNLSTQEIEIAELPYNHMGGFLPSAIADDGTLIGFSNLDTMIGRMGMVWPAGTTEATLISDWLPVKEVIQMDDYANVPCGITPDGRLIEGFYMDDDGGFLTYVINVPECRAGVAGVDADDADAVEGVYDLSGRRVADRPFNLGKGVYIVKKSAGAEKIMVK